MLHENIIQIREESLSGEIVHQWDLSFASPKITVRELISKRVREEVTSFNDRPDAHFRGLVEPSEAEQTLNGYKLKTRRQIDADKQIAIALDAFGNNGFFMLLDDRQLETLDEEIVIDKDMAVSFVKLTPLVGG